MEFGQRLRAWLLEPLLRLLVALRITPDAITLTAGLVGLAFIPLWLNDYQAAALCCIALHILLDGVDGPLARYCGSASSQGSFTDTFTDQCVITGVTIAWMIHQPSSYNIAAGTTYVFVYAMVVAMAMVRNALHIPYSWLIRPRFFVYLGLLVDFFSGWNITLVVMLVCIPVLGLKMASGFLALRKSLPGSD